MDKEKLEVNPPLDHHPDLRGLTGHRQGRGGSRQGNLGNRAYFGWPQPKNQDHQSPQGNVRAWAQGGQGNRRQDTLHHQEGEEGRGRKGQGGTRKARLCHHPQMICFIHLWGIHLLFECMDWLSFLIETISLILFMITNQDKDFKLNFKLKLKSW